MSFVFDGDPWGLSDSLQDQRRQQHFAYQLAKRQAMWSSEEVSTGIFSIFQGVPSSPKWLCGYCGSKHENKVRKCTQCGAPEK